jgi:hypothetical protein
MGKGDGEMQEKKGDWQSEKPSCMNRDRQSSLEEVRGWESDSQ